MKNQIVTTARMMRQLRKNLRDAATDLKEGAQHYADSQDAIITCTPGCANCCYQKILVGAAEGLSIYIQLRMDNRWNDAEVERLTKLDREMTERTHRAWFGEKRPCPFLLEEKPGWGKCSVYSVRPISCAATFSVGGDPKHCEADDYSPEALARGQVQVSGKTQNNFDYLKTLLHFQLEIERCPECYFMTLPGAVIWAAARIEGRTPPDVRRVILNHDNPTAVPDRFDEAAIYR